MKVLACATLALLVSSPVLGDPSGNYTANLQISSGTEIDNDSTESARGLNTRLEGAHSDGCVRLMERAFYMADPASLAVHSTHATKWNWREMHSTRAMSSPANVTLSWPLRTGV